MNKLKSALVAILIVSAGSAAMALDFSFGVRTDNAYVSVGKYDYYPYGVPYGSRARVSFYDVMSDYGYWVDFQPFGRVWRPYADNRWRPYLYGHWVYTQYGPTWQGYEPWAWVGYHYGNWVFSSRFGWVWIPGYDWHPGHVTWSYGADQIGWAPAPPDGYDYFQGYLRYNGSSNPYSYNDDYYGDSYDRYRDYDDRYDRYYGSPNYANISINLWVFIGRDHFRSDNYADYCYDRNRTRDFFSRRAVRINARPFQKTQLESIVKQRIDTVPVEVREVQTERKAVRMVIPKGEEDHIRKHAQKVVQDVIKPAFEKEHRTFKGKSVQNEKAVETIFRQKGAPGVQPVNESDTRIQKDQDRKVQRDNDEQRKANERIQNERIQNDRIQKDQDRQFEKQRKDQDALKKFEDQRNNDERRKADQLRKADEDRKAIERRRIEDQNQQERSRKADEQRKLQDRRFEESQNQQRESKREQELDLQRRQDIEQQRMREFNDRNSRQQDEQIDRRENRDGQQEKIIREQDNSDQRNKQADKNQKESDNNKKKQKDKKKNNDHPDKPDRQR